MRGGVVVVYERDREHELDALDGVLGVRSPRRRCWAQVRPLVMPIALGTLTRGEAVATIAESGGILRPLSCGALISSTPSRRRRSLAPIIFSFALVATACGSDTGTVADGTSVASTAASSTTVATSSTGVATTSTETTTTTSVPATTTSLPATTSTRGPVNCENDVFGFTLLVPGPWNVSGGATADAACRQVSKPGRGGNPIIVEAYPDAAFPQSFAWLRVGDDQRALVDYIEYATEGGIDAFTVVQEIIAGDLAGRRDIWVVIDTVPPIVLFVAIEDLGELEEIREFMTQLASSIVTD